MPSRAGHHAPHQWTALPFSFWLDSAKERHQQWVTGECSWGMYSLNTPLLGLRLVTFNPVPQVSAPGRWPAPTATFSTPGNSILPFRSRDSNGFQTLQFPRCCPTPAASLHPAHTFINSPFSKLFPQLLPFQSLSLSCWDHNWHSEFRFRPSLKDLGYSFHCLPILWNSIQDTRCPVFLYHLKSILGSLSQESKPEEKERDFWSFRQDYPT